MSPLIHDKAEHLRFRYSVYAVISFVLLLWLVKAFEIASETSLSDFGVLPRTLKGSIGIFTGPLVHGDVVHLLSNSLPILVLGILLFYFYHKIALEIFVWIYLVSGFWVWLLARDAYHIGASGIVYGMASFLFFSGIFRKSRQLMTVSAIIIFLYGGMIYGIIPDAVEGNVSWESHLLGGMVGLLLSFLFRNSVITFGNIESNEQQKDKPDEPDTTIHTNATASIDIIYTYKPTKKSNQP